VRPTSNAAGAIRGSALPETAVVLSFILVMVLGTIQMGLVGGLQLMVDGAAFVAAHEYSLNYANSNATNQQTVLNTFPQVNVLPINIASNPPTVLPTNVPVTYPNVQSAREGGTSLIRRSNFQATVDATGPAGALGKFLNGGSKFGVHGSAIEPLSWQSNPQYDVANAGYTNTSPVQNAFFGGYQDVPYSYVSMQRMSMCLALGLPNVAPQFGTSCATTSVEFSALGSAEFLDQDNWQRPNIGFGPQSGSWTFSEMLCHQQVYANAIGLFPAVTSDSAIVNGPGKQNTFDIVNGNANGDANATLREIYAWDHPVAITYPAWHYAFYPYWASWSYGSNPLHPGAGC
jgi:hypothetical protein